jgi:hypothetical protein
MDQVLHNENLRPLANLKFSKLTGLLDRSPDPRNGWVKPYRCLDDGGSKRKPVEVGRTRNSVYSPVIARDYSPSESSATGDHFLSGR